MFCDWFDIELHSAVSDLSDAALVDDGEDL